MRTFHFVGTCVRLLFTLLRENEELFIFLRLIVQVEIEPIGVQPPFFAPDSQRFRLLYVTLASVPDPTWTSARSPGHSHPSRTSRPA